MKPFTHAPHFAALLLSLVAASCARADWLSSLTYSVAVSNSPSGPFAATVNLGGAGTGIELASDSNPAGFVVTGMAVLPLGLLIVNYGTPAPVFPPQMPFSFQVTPQGKKSLMLSGQLSIPNNGEYINFANGGAVALTVGHRTLDITLGAALGQGGPESPESIAPPGLAPPGSTPFVLGYDIYATVPLAELARAPEPSGFVLAGMGAVALLGASRRSRRLQPI